MPVKQQRGRDTRDRLLDAGRRLVAARDIDTILVAEIARAADCSVGSFYLRFQDKSGFFRALIAHYAADSREATRAVFSSAKGDKVISALVASYVERFRNYGGLIRSAIRKRMEDPDMWEPVRRNGHLNADRTIAWLAQSRGRALGAAEEMRVRFAFQVLHGTLNNAVINRPGPLDLEDDAFVVHLERAFRLALLTAGPVPRLRARRAGK